MAKVRISRGKFEGIQACAGERGVIAALAIDQRDALRKSMQAVSGQEIPDEALVAFKQCVTKILTRYASALLIDPVYGLAASKTRTPGTGLLLSYERTGYDNAGERLPALLTNWSVQRLVEAGADAVKVLLYFNPCDDTARNDEKRVFIERVGAECAALDVPFFLEPLAYDDRYEAQGLDFARLKPRYVCAIMEEFSRPRYGVDILKVEIPINPLYLAGSETYRGGEAAYTLDAALDHFRAMAAAAKKPFLYLSAGVNDTVFRESLELAAEAGTPFSGVLCGRATWKGGVQVFVQEGEEALERWLLAQGVHHIQELNRVLARSAQPWYTIYGGRENIEIV